MEFADDIETNENEVETAAGEKKNKIFFAMLNGQTVKGTVSTSRGDFKVKFPKQKDVISIGRLAALMRGGIPAGNFDEVSEYEIQKCAALDIMVCGGPAWYENARKKDKNFSWRNAPDARFVDEVYAKALEFRQKVQERLAGNQENAAAGHDEENAGGIPSDVGDGLFSGASGAAERDKP